MLDLALPDGDGRDVCRELRRRSDVPIVMLTARGTELDKIVGLELGADDYVVKPFSAAEVISRIRAVLRRSGDAATRPAEPIRIGELELDPAARIARLGGGRARALAQGVRPARRADAPRRPRGHARGPDGEGLGRQLVRLDQDARRPRRLAAAQARRRSQPPPYIETVRGVGFRFAAPAGERAMSLRATLLLALAYVLLLALIAFGVPLAVSLRDRVDSEVKGQARSQADVVAATAAELLDARAANGPEAAGQDLGRKRPRPGDRRRPPRPPARRLGRRPARAQLRQPARDPRGAARQRRADHPRQQHARRPRSSPPRCPCSSTAGPAVRCGSRRASRPSIAPCEPQCSTSPALAGVVLLLGARRRRADRPADRPADPPPRSRRTARRRRRPGHRRRRRGQLRAALARHAPSTR